MYVIVEPVAAFLRGGSSSLIPSASILRWDCGVADRLELSARARQDSQSIIAAIKAEGLSGTEATVLFYTLTDTIGPRLTGSPAHVQAARWAMERLKASGLGKVAPAR